MTLESQSPTAIAALTSFRDVEEPVVIEISHQARQTFDIPRTSPERLAQAAEDAPRQEAATTVLYLAYGSNLSAETFMGVRGIRPLSRVNVAVPTLELTFSLPGIPYTEPCFANVDYRKLPKNPKLPDNPIIGHPPPIVPIKPPMTTTAGFKKWDGPLIGVAYEVTRQDYQTIIRTEGGGSGYQEIPVVCIPLPPRMSVPEKPPIPELPKPFVAQTLYAPYLPPRSKPPPGDDPRKKRWWYRFLISPQRPDPNYAQPSARYLKLLTDGAAENELPDDYQQWLGALQPYTMTSRRQKIGKAIFGVLVGLLMFIMQTVLKPFAGDDGRLPHWLRVGLTAFFAMEWAAYDHVIKPICGDGERTEEPEEEVGHGRPEGFPFADEEKAGLLARDW